MGIHHGVSKKVKNLTNASSRSIESFFSVSNEKVDGGEAVQKKRKEEDLDGEVENVDDVAELRKRTEAKTSSYEKKFHSRWLNDFSWLKHNNDKGMLCELCMRCGKQNPFTVGCKNYRTSSLSRHAEMCDHKNALMSATMQTDLKKAMEKALSRQEEGITTAQKVAYWLAKENVATRKFSSLMNLLRQTSCPHVDKLSCGENANYMSDPAAEEFQEACAKVISKEIEKEIQQSRFLSVLVDESTDISVTQKLVVYVRFMTEDFVPKTRFVKNPDLSDGKAATILDTLKAAEIDHYGNEKLEVLIEHNGKDQETQNGVVAAVIDGPACRREWSIAKHLVLQQKYPRDEMSLLWKIMYQNHKDVIPNLIILAELALILPIHTADCERGFSKQNLIKSKSRNRIGDAALNRLMLISIEGKPLEEFDFVESLSVWKAKKDRRIFHKT